MRRRHAHLTLALCLIGGMAGMAGAVDIAAAADWPQFRGPRGKLALLEATPEEYRQLGSAQVLDGKCWTSPSLADGRLYVRNEEQLIALDWKGAATAAPARTGR